MNNRTPALKVLSGESGFVEHFQNSTCLLTGDCIVRKEILYNSLFKSAVIVAEANNGMSLIFYTF